MSGFKQVPCDCCAGVSWGGEVPAECPDCRGAGSVWMLPNGAVAMWPGGPFAGSWGAYGRKKYEAAT